MRIAHISDWHTLSDLFLKQLEFEIRHQQIEQPDAVFITGDMLRNFTPSLKDLGNEDSLQRLHYEGMIDHLNQIWQGVDIYSLRGNHDWCNYGIPGSVFGFDKIEGEGYKLGPYKVWGFRGVGWFHGFWQDEYSEKTLQGLCDLVPKDTNILVTHDPPEGVLDDVRDIIRLPNEVDRQGLILPRHIGSPAIRKLVDTLPDLKVHMFGHVHEQGGRVQVRGQMAFSNAAGTLNILDLDAIESFSAQPKANTWECDLKATK